MAETNMIRSPIKWVGGKSRLRRVIIPQIPPHKCYVEVFGGAAWVLFGKAPSPVEVLNDIDSELINFFRVVQDQPTELINSFEWSLASREEFERLLALDTTSLTPLERAHRFYYIIMASWGGELGLARFQTSISDGGHGNRLIGALKSLEQRIRPAHQRLRTVVIENLSWETCIERYDDLGTFFYLDPPYPRNKVNYAQNMRDPDHHYQLLERLEQVKAKWLLSTYDNHELRDLTKDYDILPVEFPSGMRGNGYRNQEILVANFLLTHPSESDAARSDDSIGPEHDHLEQG